MTTGNLLNVLLPFCGIVCIPAIISFVVGMLVGRGVRLRLDWPEELPEARAVQE